MPQPTIQPHLSSTPTADSFFLPVAFAHAHDGMQEPGTTPDTPSGAGPQGTAGPGTPGSTQVPDPNQPGAPSPCAGDNNMFLFLGLGLALMYFLVMRPESKRRKEQQAMLAAVKVGDRVVTLGGMHGVVAALAEKTLTLRVDTVKVTIDRTAIARVERDEAPSAPAKSS
jgi:preprotein translocase subunit YajC